jgi:hypothetical protein
MSDDPNDTADTCDICGAGVECIAEAGWLLCPDCAGQVNNMEISDAAWRLSWWIYDCPAERVGWLVTRQAQMEVS